MDSMKKRAHFYCAIDGEEMAFIKGKYSWYYCCPKHFREYRTDDSKPCKNRLSVLDANIIYSHLEEAERLGDLKRGYEEEMNKIYFRVFSVDKYEVKVYVLNKESTGWGGVIDGKDEI